MSFVLARKLDAETQVPEPHNRQFVEFDGARYKVCSMCHDTQEGLVAALGDSRMDGVIRMERYDTVVVADHCPVGPLVVREAVGLEAFRALWGSAEA